MIPSLEVRQRMEAEEQKRAQRSFELLGNETLCAAEIKTKKKHRYFRYSVAGKLRNQELKKAKAEKNRLKSGKGTVTANNAVLTKSKNNKSKYNRWKKMRKSRSLVN